MFIVHKEKVDDNFFILTVNLTSKNVEEFLEYIDELTIQGFVVYSSFKYGSKHELERIFSGTSLLKEIKENVKFCKDRDFADKILN